MSCRPSLPALPFVSVIVPARNAGATLRHCLAALCRQTYPPGRLEVIVVDDGSTDGTAAIARGFNVRLFALTDGRGPYAGRNLGISESRGEVIAFTDADCAPEQDWVAEGVAGLRQGRADLAAGQIRFTPAARCRGPAEAWDSVSFLCQEALVRERGAAVCANLFVTRSLLERHGSFRADLRSGADVIYTATATRHGNRLLYVENAVVEHASRGWAGLLRKGFRVGCSKRAESRAGPTGPRPRLRGYRQIQNLEPRVLARRLKVAGADRGAAHFAAAYAAGVLTLLAAFTGVAYAAVSRRARGRRSAARVGRASSPNG